MLRGTAFSPGHVTGFFEIHDTARDVRMRGSTGVGICLSLGVQTEIGITRARKQDIAIHLNGRKAEAPVTRHVVERMAGSKKLKVAVDSVLGLPLGQGFGMSGAGALSTAMAMSEAMGLDLSRTEVTCIAHEAEIACATGLGDVVPQSLGGVAIRRKEGCFPFGVVENMDIRSGEIVLCVIGEPLSTGQIIRDRMHKERINKHGSRCLSEFLKEPDIHNVFKQSIKFARATKLMSTAVKKAVDAAGGDGYASMSMLGNSVFCLGDAKILARTLQSHGDVYTCSIEKHGARIVDGD